MLDHFDGIIVSLFASGVVDRGFGTLLGQTAKLLKWFLLILI
jgi:hypothetical protein